MAIERQHRPIDKEFEECDYTGILDISGRKLRMFPNIGDDIYDQLEVFSAVISGNRFDKFPKQVLNYLNIVTLNFHNNSLRSIPSELTKLHQLRHLDLSRNFLQKLPPSICDMQLETLSVNNNRLQRLPQELGKMNTLKSLDASCNDMTELPPSITELQSLLYLNLRRNEIRGLPTEIFKIPLWYLNVSSNSLTRLPIALVHLTTLTEFDCSDNPLELPPAQICVRGLTHVFKYLKEMEKYGSDPQLFASNREESLMRRRRERGGKRPLRPTSDASTLSGDGSDYERSFLDEMSTFVQSAFGGKDGHFLGRNESESAGVGSKHWTQYHAYEDKSPCLGAHDFNRSGVRYRSQSPGPVLVQSSSTQAQQNTPTHSSSGTHYGTLPRSNRDSGGNLAAATYRGLIDEPPRSGSFHNYTTNRVASPVYGGTDNRALRTLSSENTPTKHPSNPDLLSYSSHREEKSLLSKRTELPPPQNSSTPNQYHSSSLQTPPASSKTVSDDNSVIDEGVAVKKRPPSPATSRDGSITPTPEEDIDLEEPLTPKKISEELTVTNVIKLLEENDFNYSSNWDALGQELGVSLDDRQRVSVQAHLSQDYRSAMEDIIRVWLKEQDHPPSWRTLANALEECGQSSIVAKMKRTLLLDEGILSDVNTTPQHQATVDKQVSFSATISEIPGRISSVSSSEPDEQDIEYTRSMSSPPKTEEMEQEAEQETGESESPSPSPSPSPSHLQTSPRKGPQPAPKPSKKKDKENTTWPRQRTSGAYKRKGDVFKSIGKQDPNFTVRRMEVHMQEELEKIQDIKKEVEDILSVKLSHDLGDDVSDGVLLCQLVNQLHPNTISTIHIAKKGDSLSVPKKTMNIAGFIAACKKLGVPEALICSAGDILEYKDPIRVCSCIRGLLDTVSV